MRQHFVVVVVGLLASVRPAAAINCTNLLPAQCCAANKIIAVAAAAAAQAKCYSAVAENPNGYVDPACLAKARANLVKAFEKAEAAGGCATVGDANAINTRIIDVFGVESAPGFPPTPAPPTCDCGAATPVKLKLAGQTPSGICGMAVDSDENVRDLSCGITYTGGGANDGQISSSGVNEHYLAVESCTGSRLQLGPTTAAEVGVKSCSSAGCYFGSPYSLTTPQAIDICVVTTVRYDATGTADCRTGEVNMAEPLEADVYLGFCPTCTGGTCNSGANSGGACTIDGPGDASVDCLPAAASLVGTAFTFDFVHTTGSQTKRPLGPGSENFVFCGFCRNPGDLTFENAAHPCVLDSDCDESPYTACLQYTEGAFGDPGVNRITMTGSPAGDLTDGEGHVGILATAFCIGPSPNEGINANGDLPSPGAGSMVVEVQLLASPSGAFVDAVPSSPWEGR
jgi:hypothetical protein